MYTPSGIFIILFFTMLIKSNCIDFLIFFLFILDIFYNLNWIKSNINICIYLKMFILCIFKRFENVQNRRFKMCPGFYIVGFTLYMLISIWIELNIRFMYV